MSRSLATRAHSFLVGNESPADSYWSLRLWLLRGLGLIYLNVFSIIYFQGLALWGRNGLLPITTFVQAVRSHFGETLTSFLTLPSLFYFVDSDSLFHLTGLIGIGLSLVLILGFANLPILVALWFLQLSFVNSGQLFYGYGWQTQVLELTFLCFFLVPAWELNLKTTITPPARAVIWAIRWELFRLMLGAGLIKIRGDECWRDLTCLIYHYETQPNPNPISFFYHHMPAWFHYGGVVFNHFVELVVPFGFFGPKRVRRVAGCITVVFQLILISSGNLAWLNWLTLLMCIACFDDEALAKFGARFKVRPPEVQSSMVRLVFLTSFAAMILVLSVNPALNLVSSEQAMNTSYSGWHLINSYGAFGSIGKERNEIIIEGTEDSVITDKTVWQEYEFPCAPGDVTRAPCWIGPYHYHLDWQIWFSGMRPELQEEWLFRLAVRLLENDQTITALFRKDPFPGQAPHFIRMELYRYRFADWKDWPQAWWKRQLLTEYMPPISLETPMVSRFRKAE